MAWPWNPVADLQNCLNLLTYYSLARKDNLPIRESKFFATCSLEQQRHSGSPCNLYSSRRHTTKWYEGTSEYADVEIFNRLVKEAIGRIPAIPRLYGKNREQLKLNYYHSHPNSPDNYEVVSEEVRRIILQVLKETNPELLKELRTIQRNYTKISGLTAPKILTRSFLVGYKSWRKIKTGRKLFVKGWGKFDIRTICEKSRLSPHSQYISFVNPSWIQAKGYQFSEYRLNSVLTKRHLREYMTRHINWFRQNPSRLDELLPYEEVAALRVKELLHLSPEAMFRRLAIERNERDAERQRLNGPRISKEYGHFEHVAELPDVPTKFGILHPLRSGQEIIEIGQNMGNCASAYIHNVASGSDLLIALLDERGNPLGLGQVKYDKHLQRWLWIQRQGPNHANLAKDIKDVFETYPLMAAGIYGAKPSKTNRGRILN